MPNFFVTRLTLTALTCTRSRTGARTGLLAWRSGLGHGKRQRFGLRQSPALILVFSIIRFLSGRVTVKYVRVGLSTTMIMVTNVGVRYGRERRGKGVNGR